MLTKFPITLHILTFSIIHYMRSLCLCLLALMGLMGSAMGQSLAKDRLALNLVQQAMDKLHNGEFDRADSLMEGLPARYARHPATATFKALMLYNRFFPILQNRPMYEVYKQQLLEVITISQAAQKANEGDAEAMFFEMMGHTMLGRSAADEGEKMDAVVHTRHGFPLIKRGFALKEGYPDFYFSTGLYHYYRERYPEDHPLYKPFLMFFPAGNKKEGIADLERAAERAIFTHTEASVFLINITLHLEAQREQALNYSTELYRKYPGNFFFKALHIEALMINGRTSEAATIMQTLNGPAPYHRAAVAALQGWVEERQKDHPQAETLYKRALELSADVKKANNNHRGYAYAGLARIAASRGQTKEARAYYKQAAAITQSILVKNEARKYLR